MLKLPILTLKCIQIAFDQTPNQTFSVLRNEAETELYGAKWSWCLHILSTIEPGVKIIGFGLKYISKQIEQIFENYVAKIEQIYI